MSDNKPEAKDVQDLYIPDRVHMKGTSNKPEGTIPDDEDYDDTEIIIDRFEHSTNQVMFVYFLAFSALFIAGCAAYFSVRGIALLFAGSMIPVAIMASSLELGKLMTASFLYRKWKKCNIVMKTYLTAAVIFLIGITTLGIFGYLSDAFDKTMTKVTLLESEIVQIEKQIVTHEKEIMKIESSADVINVKANDSIVQYQKIYDDYVNDQRTRQDSLRLQLKTLDTAIADIESSKGGLFSNKTGKLKLLRESQQPDRAAISASLLEVDKNIDGEYKRFIDKVEKLRETTEQVPDNVDDVNIIYSKIRELDQGIANRQDDIRNTDIGSFKFISRSFDIPLEVIVKWFILLICIVFDPLAVVLIIGLNMMLKDMPKTIKNNRPGKEKETVEKIVEVDKIIEVEKIVEVEKIIEVEKIVEVDKSVSPMEAMFRYWKDRKGGK